MKVTPILVLTGTLISGCTVSHTTVMTSSHPVTSHPAPTMTVTKYVTVHENPSPVPTVTITQTPPGLLRCTQLLRDVVETYALFEDDQAGYPSAVNGFNPDENICAPYVSFGTQYSLAHP